MKGNGAGELSEFAFPTFLQLKSLLLHEAHQDPVINFKFQRSVAWWHRTGINVFRLVHAIIFITIT